MKEDAKFPAAGQRDFMNDELENLEQNFSKAASLIGEKSRSVMLWNLLDGRAYTATELAVCANISRQTCSAHLAKMVEANLLSVIKQGRHKYYKFADDNAPRVIESIGGLLAPHDTGKHALKTADKKGIMYARTCYDHLAGKLAVDITSSLVSGGIIIGRKDGYSVTGEGEKWFSSHNIAINKLMKLKRKFAYPCLDWSERKSHIGGALGTAILNLLYKNDWIRKTSYSREVIITGKGKTGLNKLFGIEV